MPTTLDPAICDADKRPARTITGPLTLLFGKD